MVNLRYYTHNFDLNEPHNAMAFSTYLMGQGRDYGGAPIYLHLVRVTNNCLSLKGSPCVATDGLSLRSMSVVAALHDTVEDCPVSLENLREMGLREELVEAVDSITHRPGERYADYIVRCAENRLARMVKVADLLDNTDPVRMARLDGHVQDRLSDKYLAAFDYISEVEGYDVFKERRLELV